MPFQSRTFHVAGSGCDPPVSVAVVQETCLCLSQSLPLVMMSSQSLSTLGVPNVTLLISASIRSYTVDSPKGQAFVSVVSPGSEEGRSLAW